MPFNRFSRLIRVEYKRKNLSRPYLFNFRLFGNNFRRCLRTRFPERLLIFICGEREREREKTGKQKKGERVTDDKRGR